MVKYLKVLLFFTILAFVCTASSAATHYECYDKRFGSVTKNFVLDGKDLYAVMNHTFEPREDFVNPTKHWTHLGGGRFKHSSDTMPVVQCKKTNVKYKKPQKATSAQAIRLCHVAIRNDHKSNNPKMPKNREKYALLTKGEFRQSPIDRKYGDVVIEVEHKGWLFGGLYLAICLVDLTDHEASVSSFSRVDHVEHFDYSVDTWYKIQNTQLVD